MAWFYNFESPAMFWSRDAVDDAICWSSAWEFSVVSLLWEWLFKLLGLIFSEEPRSIWTSTLMLWRFLEVVLKSLMAAWNLSKRSLSSSSLFWHWSSLFWTSSSIFLTSAWLYSLKFSNWKRILFAISDISIALGSELIGTPAPYPDPPSADPWVRRLPLDY